MLMNHLKIALRTVTKHKGYTAINLFGLAVGIACFIIIVLFVRDELSYDQYHRDSDRIYRVVVDRFQAGSTEARILTPAALGLAIGREIPEIAQTTRLVPSILGKLTLTNENNTISRDSYLMVDSSFFNVFTFSFLSGSAEYAMVDPEAIVLTETLARTLFGENEALGQTISLDGARSMTVTGIIEDVPLQSHFQFEYLIPFPNRGDDCWNATCFGGYAYVKLAPQAIVSDVESKIQQLVEANQSEVREDVYFLQPLAGLNGIHLASHRVRELSPNSHKLYINVLAGAGLFIILIAGINYVNLATARSAMRAKEIGVRKVVGAERGTLIRQFLMESVLMSAAAGVLATALTELALPFFNSVTQKELSFLDPGNVTIWWLIAGVVLVFGLAAGSYPAFYLSGFKPVAVLKNLRASGQTRTHLRQFLVGFQFVLAALLMVSALVVQKQLEFMQSADLGFDKDHVMVIKNFGKVPRRDVDFTVRSELAEISGVAQIGSTTNIAGLNKSDWGTIKTQGSDEEAKVAAARVDYDYLEAVGIELAEGRGFSPEFETDSSPLTAILNETAVDRLNLKGSAIGQVIELPWPGAPTLEVIGVVKDFHFTSLHEQITPFVFFWGPKAYDVAVKIHGGNILETISQIEATFARFAPGFPMDYFFLDSEIDKHYRSEQNFKTLFSVMTGLSLLIACLGMFGLVAFTVEQRTKEIGVRKVLGATVANVVTLLSRDFVKLVVVGNVVALPIAYWVMHKWLQNFAYHTDMSASIFVSAVVLALLVAVLTVSWQAVAAAIANPVDSLRSE
jgi:putative ABC transport system permease protein